MIKKLRVTVDGNSYDVTVEVPDDSNVPAAAAPAVSAAPAAPATPAPRPAAPAPAPAAPAPAAKAVAGSGDVPSPLTGRVTAVVVTAGQQVKEGDHLITLEAMKMNTFVFAPKSGKVAAINVAVGDSVEEHQALARIE
jgi:glutaconyl-CoA/methylmalonyl-CoA decarboxylase subunit gamma